MQYRIVADSSSNVFELPGADYAHVPLKIINCGREYVDVPGLDVFGMLEEMKASREGSSTSCPNAFEWEQAFGEAECVFAVTITGNLSGSCAAARAAAEEEEKNLAAQEELFFAEAKKAIDALKTAAQYADEELAAVKSAAVAELEGYKADVAYLAEEAAVRAAAIEAGLAAVVAASNVEEINAIFDEYIGGNSDNWRKVWTIYTFY